MGLFDGLMSKLPGIGGLFDDSSDNAEDMYLKALKGYQDLKTPDGAYQNYTPEGYSQMGDFNPEAYNYQTLSEDPTLLSKQKDYLNQLKDLSMQGFSPEDAAVFDKARSQSAQQARGANEAVMANMRARGTAGGGQELLQRELSNQAGAERARSSMMDQASASAKQRALYEQAYGNEMTGQRAADEKTAAGNADIINNFNKLNTTARNTAAYDNMQNRAKVNNANIDLRNEAQYKNQQGARTAAQNAYQNQLSRLSGLAGQYQNAGKMYAGEAEANAKSRAGAGTAIGSMFGPVGGAVGGALGNLF